MSSIVFAYSDGGRRISGRPGETRDCTVRALALALDIPYDIAHAGLAKLGRKPRHGFLFRMPNLGEFSKVLEECPEYSCRTVRKVLPELMQGRFIVRVRGHVFAVVGGTALDVSPTKPGRRVCMVYRVKPRL
jgi:hypothetical protein